MDATVGAARPDGHHGLATHEVVLLLETDAQHGLDDREVGQRLERYGPNVLPEAKTGGPLLRLARQFHNPLIYVLLAAGVVTLVLGENIESGVIFGVVVINAIVGYIQESKAEAALDALRAMVQTEARVRRSGRELKVPSDQLVPGDVVLIEAGDKVPADLRLLQVTELQVDESALTGESVPVAKDEVVLADATPVADRRNMVYSATLVTNGTGVGVTVATGAETEVGEIHRLVGTADTLATPLTRKLSWFSKVLTFAILALAAITFAVGVLRGESAAEMFTAAVALGGRRDPRGPPGRGHDHARHRGEPHGPTASRHPTPARSRDPGQHDGGVFGQDRDPHREPDDGPRLWTPDARFDVTGSGYDPDGTIRDPDASMVTADADRALRWTLVAGAVCNDALLTHIDDTWGIVGDPDRRRPARRRDQGGTRPRRARHHDAASRRDPVQLRPPVHGHPPPTRRRHRDRSGQRRCGTGHGTVRHRDEQRRIDPAPRPRRDPHRRRRPRRRRAPGPRHRYRATRPREPLRARGVHRHPHVHRTAGHARPAPSRRRGRDRGPVTPPGSTSR